MMQKEHHIRRYRGLFYGFLFWIQTQQPSTDASARFPDVNFFYEIPVDIHPVRRIVFFWCPTPLRVAMQVVLPTVPFPGIRPNLQSNTYGGEFAIKVQVPAHHHRFEIRSYTNLCRSLDLSVK